MLAEYEERLVRRRREVRELQEQRDQLLATQRRLQELQQSMTLSVHVRIVRGLFGTLCCMCLCETQKCSQLLKSLQIIMFHIVTEDFIFDF